MDTGAAGVADFVQRKIQSTGHTHSTQLNGVNGQDKEQQDVKSRPANEKRRREAQYARVSTPRHGLTAENLNAHHVGGKRIEETQSTDSPNQPAQQTAVAHSLFGTDSGHADDTTVLSIVHADDHQTELTRPPQGVTYSSGVEDDNDAAPSDITRQGISFNASLLQPQGPSDDLPPRCRTPGPTEVDLFGGGASYPPTTAGDTDTDVLSHASADTGSAGFDRQPTIRSQRRRMDRTPLNQTSQPSIYANQLQQRAHNQALSAAFIPSFGRVNGHDGIAMRSGSRKVLDNGSTTPPKVILEQKGPVSEGASAALHAHYAPAQIPMHNQGPHLESSQNRRGHSHELLNDGLEGDDQLDIDYDESELVEMPYEALLRESQDHVPGAKAFEMPHAIASAPLSKKLGHVKGLERADQAAFFATLDQSDWEEAGDWFLDQFGAVIKAFRDARKEKRGLAAEVEATIHGRHSAIETKKRSIDEALADMRSNGATVLSTPPHKKRRD